MKPNLNQIMAISKEVEKYLQLLNDGKIIIISKTDLSVDSQFLLKLDSHKLISHDKLLNYNIFLLDK